MSAARRSAARVGRMALLVVVVAALYGLTFFMLWDVGQNDAVHVGVVIPIAVVLIWAAVTDRKWHAVLLVTVLAVTVLAGTVAGGAKPLLGLDLQGGVSVVLKPKPPYSDDTIDQAIAIMNQRVNALGVAEPDIHREGDTIVVQLAGVKDPQQAIDSVGKTAELRFRPVLASLGVPLPTTTTPEGTTPGSTPTGTAPGGEPPDGSTATTPVPGAVEAPPTSAAGTQERGAGLAGAPAGESAQGVQPTTPPVTEAPPVTDAPAAPTAATPTAATPDASSVPSTPATPDASSAPATTSTETTPPDQDKADQTVVLPQYGPDGTTVVERLQLGPAAATGKALEDASAGLGQQGEWVVRPKFKPGADGIDLFNKMAAECKAKSSTCPTGRGAITLDGAVVSAPTIREARFDADRIEISGNFDEESARKLATQLKYGALPVELEQQSTEQVSPTLGSDALRAGLIAGAIGLVLVSLYMLAWYRLLGLLALAKLAVEACFLYAFIVYMGTTAGLALTLAGITGIIVSIGVSLDSNIVYYEHLREDVQRGRTVRSATDKSFDSSWSTILKADGASLLGAVLLYALAVGPVRGFAFYLGLSTLLDVIGAYTFMRPAVGLATRSSLCARRPAVFGIPAGATPVGDGGPAGRRGAGAPGGAGGGSGRAAAGAAVGTGEEAR